ncbi:hypothetical protein B4114_1509 [Geobacillus stearothermophilus]|uniref:Uncharacterized protein n=1 Tax=Geobacillus stearothermophilus TaxID=1422 RepID=A0A150N7C4_GEOSE|nr:hypothetical protein B4114_1509 [Geobacillus stearothermophilus]
MSKLGSSPSRNIAHYERYRQKKSCFAAKDKTTTVMHYALTPFL